LSIAVMADNIKRTFNMKNAGWMRRHCMAEPFFPVHQKMGRLQDYLGSLGVTLVDFD
jgi:hypothetical protein